MLGSHLHVFIWQGILLLFFIIFPLVVKLPLATCKGTCEGGAHWNRRAEAPAVDHGRRAGGRPTWSEEDGMQHCQLVVRAFAACASRSPAASAVSRRLLVLGLWLLHTWVLLALVGCISVGWVTGSRHFCVPPHTAHAEVKGGSVLTSPCQNPVESSGMRAGVLPKVPFSAFDTWLWGCLHT